jgi:hypothetical protein
MSLQNPFHNSVSLNKVVASIHSFVPDENIFSGLYRFSEKGILNTSLHLMELKVQSVNKHSFVYMTQSMPESEIMITYCL